MMNHSRRSLCAKNGLQGRKAAYSAAAAATAVAAGATDAQANLVYTDPTDISISQGFSQGIDLNGDSQTDVNLKNFVFYGRNYQGAAVSYAPGKLVLSNATFPYYVTALSAGDSINASTVGLSFQGSLAYGTTNPNAEFQAITDGFIGLSFPAGTETLYGWVRVSIDNSAGSFLIHDWAYTDSPDGILAGQTIAAIPETATLGFFAAGSIGLAALRRRRALNDESMR